MAALCWVVLGLAVLLSPQRSLAAVNQDWLTNIIQNLKNEYALGDSYSLAVNIPVNQDLGSLAEVLKDDPADAVKQAISAGQVYQGTRVVAAVQSGALGQVLEKIQPLIKSSDGNVLIVYSEGYPDANGIDNKISDVVQNWKSYAFVFSKVADVADADTLQRAALFKQQEVSKFGLENIFRCYEQSNSFQCTNCKEGDNVAPSCVADTTQSNGNEETAVGTPAPPAGSDEGTISGSNNGIDTGSITSEEGGEVIGGGKGGKGGKVRKSRRRGKGGKVRKSRRRGKGRKMRKSRRRGKGRKMRKSRRRGKGSKMRKSRRRGKGGKMRKSRRRGKGRKMRKSRRRGKGRKMRKSRRRGKGRKMRKSRRRGKGRKMRKSRRRGKGRKMRKSRRRKSGKRRRGYIANSA